MYQTINSREVA